jgi:insulin-like growth factor 2 mRNA-binding protein 1
MEMTVMVVIVSYWDCCLYFRVDVHRKDNVGSLEKAITIYGNPDNCTNACRRILEVMQQEANNTNKG